MIRAIFFVAIILFNIASFAASEELIVVAVSDVKGNAFYSVGGSTKLLKKGMHIPAKSEIFSEVGSQITFNDYYDHIFYLSGGGHLIIHPNLIELKEGYIWVKSLSYDPIKGPLKVITANSLVEHKEGEGILSFDNYSGKTQVLSIKGDFELKNIRQEFQSMQVKQGQFSFIQDKYNKGGPRNSTPIGHTSYKKITSLFSGVEPFDEGSAELFKREYAKARDKNKKTITQPAQSSRKIASVESMDPFEAALSKRAKSSDKGRTTFISLRNPDKEREHDQSLLNYYNSKVSKLENNKTKGKWKPNYIGKSHVKVKIFGRGLNNQDRRARIPASVKPVEPNSKEKTYKTKYRTPASIGAMAPSIKTDAFESELADQYKSQMRHDEEVNQLIDQLKSIDMDYRKDY